MGQMVIAAYRPKPGQDSALLSLVREHLPVLQKEGLATGRKALVMRAADGTLLEVFEWASEEAVAQAHASPTVQALWERFAAVADYVRLGELPEAGQLFAHFSPVE